MTAPSVRLAGVAKSYGRQPAVVGVDLALEPGQRVALVGHNGAGKTTLIKLMLGLLRPTAGTVEVFGADPVQSIATRARVGYVPENVVFQPSLTGEEMLAFYARLKRQSTAKNAAIMERVDIAYAARRRVGTYSKGMRQRLGLAQALIGDPKLLLLDEPTSGLDPALRQSFYAIVRELSAGGATVLLSSHALAELEGESDAVVVMSRGRKVVEGTIAELRRLAGRPVRIRARLPDPAFTCFSTIPAKGVEWAPIGPRTVEIRCREVDKVAILRWLANRPATPEDIEVLLPSLDEIYAHFLQREATP